MFPTMFVPPATIGVSGRVSIDDAVLNSSDTFVNGPFCSYGLEPSDFSYDVVFIENNGYTYSGPWLLSGVQTDYEGRATLLSGLAPSSGSPLNTWGTWGSFSGLGWLSAAPGVGTYQTVLLIEIRDAISFVVLDSATITMNITAT